MYPFSEQSKSLRDAFVYAEKQNPGFMHDFVAGVIQNEDMTEILLRLGSTECTEYLISSNIELHAQLNMKAQSLRVLLNSIPDQIRAKSICSQTLNDIAKSMKDLLHCVNHFYKSNRNHPAVTQNNLLSITNPRMNSCDAVELSEIVLDAFSRMTSPR